MFNEEFKVRHLILGSVCAAIWGYVMIVIIAAIT